jgi:hypothetical protein
MDDPEALAFKRLYELSEELKADGLSVIDCWRVIVSTTNDLQASDIGAGTDEFAEELRLMLDMAKERVALLAPASGMQ